MFEKTFSATPKFFGETSKIKISESVVHLLKPMTYMNDSGRSTLALAQFYKIEPNQILVVHDEIDIKSGQIRLKKGGGHGGHNGLRDLHRVLGSDYARLRIGIGHPGHKSKVHDHVLSRTNDEELTNINRAIVHSLHHIKSIVQDDWVQAMNELHQR